MSVLMTPLDLGELTIPNRVVMAPLTRARSGDDRVPTDLMAEYYTQRAGAGLIISEATSVSPQGVGYHGTPGIWNDEQVAGWRKVTEAVHAAGGSIVLQLWHVGRISDPELLDGELPVAPSAIAPAGRVKRLRPRRQYVRPRALEIDEIPGIVEDFRRGAENAKRAGFDGVEIHAANGYLIDQFLQDSTNHRADEYGGSVQNRARFLLEITDAVMDVWGPGRVGVHLRPRGEEHDMGDSDPRSIFGHVAEELGARRAAFLFIREIEAADSLIGEIRQLFGGPVITNEEMDAADGRRHVDDGTADAVAFGRDYIATPDLAERIAAGVGPNTPNPLTFYPDTGDGLAVGYTDYPTMAEAPLSA
ncbi:alkene reductase [Brachybacterium sacelli]|uniref:2,4-dienoyl-CoA reductase-like NADH-dependent reductase (Old Yellow Enzyme family) n=1 Tax=Brachybacterium sacelli TaxID=173364 RepID=A0ABS4WXP5_9MICO|nr:alkene reductase [Brachybacterium sacelli]MBP2380972.1 2,4-dienoyl-CoA reductase-like NADH-dependent reductase (Old Yellow Enzyme family) [Brachybacterium sacelli]